MGERYVAAPEEYEQTINDLLDRAARAEAQRDAALKRAEEAERERDQEAEMRRKAEQYEQEIRDEAVRVAEQLREARDEAHARLHQRIVLLSLLELIEAVEQHERAKPIRDGAVGTVADQRLYATLRSIKGEE